MTRLVRLAMSLLVGAVTGLLGYIGTLALIAWAEQCQPNAPNCSLGGTLGLTIALIVALAVAVVLGRLTWRRLGRFSARSTTRAG
jgi:hypothetical protein